MKEKTHANKGLLESKENQMDALMREKNDSINRMRQEMEEKLAALNEKAIMKEEELHRLKTKLEAKYEEREEKWEEERKIEKKKLLKGEEELARKASEFKIAMDMQRHEVEMQIQSEKLNLKARQFENAN